MSNSNFFWRIILYSVFSVKDSKEFQGELFGICNLFRDLSNKLFTSDIVESHDKDGNEKDSNHGTKLDLTELGIQFDPSNGETANKHSAESNDSTQSRKTVVDPVLRELGMFF